MNDCSEFVDFYLDFRVSGFYIIMEVLKIVFIVIFMENVILMIILNKFLYLIFIV